MGINDRGQITGDFGSSIFVSTFHCYRLDGAFVTIDVPGAQDTAACGGINDRGQVVGGFDDVSGVPGFTDHGFILSKGAFTTIDFPGAVTTVARGNNDRGQIVGTYTDAAGTFHGYLANK